MVKRSWRACYSEGASTTKFGHRAVHLPLCLRASTPSTFWRSASSRSVSRCLDRLVKREPLRRGQPLLCRKISNQRSAVTGEGLTSSSSHFPPHKDGLLFAGTKLKDSTYPGQSAQVYVCEEKHWIVQFWYRSKHAKERGRTVNFSLSARRDVAAAKAFFRKAVKCQQRCPRTITLDGYAASHRAVHALKADGSLPVKTKLRSSKYLNNLIEQDHRGVKQCIAVMLGFKEFRNAAITIAGIELLRSIPKGQFRLGHLDVSRLSRA